MMKRYFLPVLLLAAAGPSFAQDMPPLPPLPSQGTVAPANNANAGSPAAPPLPDQSTAPAAPAASSGQASPAMPPLPDQSAAPAAPTNNAGGAAMPPLPDQSSAAPATPPLPNQPGAEQPSAPAAPAAPPAPDQGQAAATTEAAPPAPAAGEAKPAKKVQQPWWTKSKHRVNVILGGWVKAKGGNESSKIAWTSQEILNALIFKGYKVVKEEGKYDGQEGAGGNQFRDFTFSVPKSKLTAEVYIKQVGKRIWVRVGPSEPPAFENHSVEKVQKMRAVNLKVLALVQRKLGRRISPQRIIKSWEAPYSFARATVTE